MPQSLQSCAHRQGGTIGCPQGRTPSWWHHPGRCHHPGGVPEPAARAGLLLRESPGRNCRGNVPGGRMDVTGAKVVSESLTGARGHHSTTDASPSLGISQQGLSQGASSLSLPPGTGLKLLLVVGSPVGVKRAFPCTLALPGDRAGPRGVQLS